MGISGLLDGFSDFQRNLRFGPKLAKRVAELRKKADLSGEFYFSLVVTNPFNEKIVSTIWKAVTCCYGVGISGWLDGFINFQRNLCFGPILADRVADFQKKDDFLNVLSSLCFIESPKRKFIAQG